MTNEITPLATGFVRVPEVARTFDVTTATVQRWIRDGQLPAVRLGRLVLIPQDALRLLVERRGERHAG